MTNEEKLEYIKSNYKVVREYKSLKKENNYFYNEWVNKTSKILPSKLYKYRKCNNNNLRALQNKKAWFSKPSTWNDKIDVTVRYNLKKDLEYIDEHFDDFVLNMAFGFSNKHIQSFCKQKGFSGFEKIKDIYFSVFSKEKDIKPNKINEYLIPIVGLKNAKQITSKIQETLAIIMNDKFKSKILNLFNKLLYFSVFIIDNL